MPTVGEEGVATTGPTDSQSLARLHVRSCLVSPNHFYRGGEVMVPGTVEPTLPYFAYLASG